MLIEFSVQNYRSIKEKVTLSMIAESFDEHGEQLISVPALKDDRLLRCAAIYGANASGKSNVLHAFFRMAQTVIFSHNSQVGDKLLLTPFLLNETFSSEPISFEIKFIQNTVKYKYCFSANPERVLTESLYWYPNGRKAMIFERTGQSYKFGVEHSVQEAISKFTLENVLYLSKSTQSNLEVVRPVYFWFLSSIPAQLLDGANVITAEFCYENPTSKEVLELIKSIDIDVDDITVRKEKLATEASGNERVAYYVSFLHKYKNNNGELKTLFFPFEAESEGTRTLFRFAASIFKAINIGGILFVDELDKSLHPLAQEKIVKMFLDAEQNPKGAQLVFTTHNTNLLNPDLLRRDQIWFTEKKEDKSTDLYALSDINGVRKDDNFEKKYLVGKYGAVPFVSSRRIADA